MMTALAREPTMPKPLAQLRTLAYNLRWSWDPATQALFRRIDPSLWEATRRNPARMLQEADPARLKALSGDASYVAAIAERRASLHTYMDGTQTWFGHRHGPAAGRIAYFSAEFAIAECLPIYSGGLGVLAGDHLKSASDLGVPLVAVGLLYREGYFTQQIDAHGRQHDHYPVADPHKLPITLERTVTGEPHLVTIPYRDRTVQAQIWRAEVGRVPLYLLDTDIDANRAEDRIITNRLYGGDNEHRLRQEIVLGIGGMRALAQLGIECDVVHLNEGHAAFAAIERVRQALPASGAGSFEERAAALADGLVFTTHTPVPAGHDSFPADLLQRYIGGYIFEVGLPWERFLALGRHDAADMHESFGMTLIALRLAGRTNGVSKLHGEVSRRMWRGAWGDVPEQAVPIGHITNGVHLPTWIAEPMAELYGRHLGDGWRESADEMHWHPAVRIPHDELWRVRAVQRKAMITYARQMLTAQSARRGEDSTWALGALDPDALTIVFARRFATYKRATLLLSDPARLAQLLHGTRPVQFIFAGKAHPRDVPGQEFIRRIVEFAGRREHRGRFLFLEDYDVSLARMLVEGADVWLNVPRRPYEASGTSGMKAAANGALNLSVADGWWAEAWEEHNQREAPIGWCIEESAARSDGDQDRADAERLFSLLENEVVPLFYDRDQHGVPRGWTERMISSIHQNVPFFNTHRMVRDYVELAYLGADTVAAGGVDVKATGIGGG
jgi:glycogen phosphorylase